jgi:hypothetical protein
MRYSPVFAVLMSVISISSASAEMLLIGAGGNLAAILSPSHRRIPARCQKCPRVAEATGSTPRMTATRIGEWASYNRRSHDVDRIFKAMQMVRRLDDVPSLALPGSIHSIVAPRPERNWSNSRTRLFLILGFIIDYGIPPKTPPKIPRPIAAPGSP